MTFAALVGRKGIQMYTCVRVLAVLALVAGVGSSARGAQLNYTGSITFEIGFIPPIAFGGSGVATVNGSGVIGGPVTALSIAQGDFQLATTIPVFNASPISGLVFAGGAASSMFTVPFAPFTITLVTPTGTLTNASGTFPTLDASVPSGLGVMPLNGIGIICLFSECDQGPTANLVVPLSPVGQGGTVTAKGAVNVTVIGAPWTLGQVAIQNSQRTGFAHGPGSNTATAATSSGVVSLVTPVVVSTSLAVFPLVPTFATLDLHFVPEPGTLLLLGTGIAGLGALGRSRRRR